MRQLSLRATAIWEATYRQAVRAVLLLHPGLEVPLDAPPVQPGAAPGIARQVVVLEHPAPVSAVVVVVHGLPARLHFVVAAVPVGLLVAAVLTRRAPGSLARRRLSAAIGVANGDIP